MAMPIWVSMVTDKLLVNTIGDTTNSRANKLQMTQRATL